VDLRKFIHKTIQEHLEQECLEESNFISNLFNKKSDTSQSKLIITPQTWTHATHDIMPIEIIKKNR
jgi:hypothetical protein